MICIRLVTLACFICITSLAISNNYENALPKRASILKEGIAAKQTLSKKYTPGNTAFFEKDKKLKVVSAKLSPSDMYHKGEDISKSIDGQNKTIYHSPWGGIQAKKAIVLEYGIDDEAKVANYIVLHPRAAGSNGVIKSAGIWAKTKGKKDYVQVAEVNVLLSNSPVIVRFEKPIVKPRSFKIIVNDAYSESEDKYFVSLAEFECYESTPAIGLKKDMRFFTDETCSELKPGFKEKDISKIKNGFLQNIACHLLAGNYPNEFRVQEYKPYRDVFDLAKELKTSAYSQFENITGLYFESGDDAIVFVGSTHGENISMRVKDFGPSGDDYTYLLNTGINVVEMKGKGNAYINYYTPDYKSANDIKIHIASGKVNGYFDSQRHTEEEGVVLLNEAVSEIFDLRGVKTQLAYSVKSLRQHSAGRLKELMNIYDSIIGSQHTMMGLEKYNRAPENRMLGRVIWKGYMHADGWGAAFHDNTMQMVANPDNIKKSNWGIAHEFGHVNQVRPGMTWVGTTECTNNIYAAWIQYCFTPDKLRLEHEVFGGISGVRFNSFLNNALINNQEWGLQAGPDRRYGIDKNNRWGGDHFVKLVPLWQLHLYYHVAGEGNSWHKPYFWADVFEKVRQTDENGLTPGELQMNFVKNMCDAVQQDLSDFFIRTGILKEVDKLFDDYTSAQKTITKIMVEEAVKYAGQYPKPKHDNIFYISGNSVAAYKEGKKLSGDYNTGIEGDLIKNISHTIWKNVVVFETYSDDGLKAITMSGTGSDDNSYTRVPFEEGSTRIEAVGSDGERMVVFGKR